MGQSDLINNRTVKSVVSISTIYSLLATCWYLFCVCVLSRSRDIAQYLLNSPILLHINQPVYFMERNMEYIRKETWNIFISRDNGDAIEIERSKCGLGTCLKGQELLLRPSSVLFN